MTSNYVYYSWITEYGVAVLSLTEIVIKVPREWVDDWVSIYGSSDYNFVIDSLKAVMRDGF